MVERFLDASDRALSPITSGYLQAETPKASRWTRLDRVELDGWAADVFRLAALS